MRYVSTLINADVLEDLDPVIAYRVEVAVTTASVPFWADLDVDLAVDAYDLLSSILGAVEAPTTASIDEAARLCHNFATNAHAAKYGLDKKLSGRILEARTGRSFPLFIGAVQDCGFRIVNALEGYPYYVERRGAIDYIAGLIGPALTISTLVAALHCDHPDIVATLIADDWTAGAAVEAAKLVG